MKNNGAGKTAAMAMMCAVAYLAACFSKLIPLNIAGFLSFDFKDAVIAIAGFLLGPGAAALIAIVSSLLEMLTVSADGPTGLLMNVLSSLAFGCTASAVYITRSDAKNALLGLIMGTACMAVMMAACNLVMAPWYLGIDTAAVVKLMLPVILPFNVLKGLMNSAAAMLIYRSIIRRNGSI